MARSIDRDVLLLSQVLIYCLLIVFELCPAISLKTSSVDWQGKCLLFAEISGNDTKNCNSSVSSGESASCDFVIYSSAAELILLGLVTIYHAFIFYKSRWDPEIAQSMIIRPFLVVSFLCSVFGFIVGGVTSAGYTITTWEFSWEGPGGLCDSLHMIGIAQATLWVCCALWIFILAVTLIRHMKQRRYANSKLRAAVLMEHSRTASDDVLYETKTSYRS